MIYIVEDLKHIVELKQLIHVWAWLWFCVHFSFIQKTSVYRFKIWYVVDQADLVFKLR